MSHPFNLKDPVHFLAVGFGSGLIKPAPGTWGTLAAALLYFFVLQFLPLAVFWGFVVLVSIAGIYICGKPARDIGEHDHGSIVWDEFAGYWLTIAVGTLLVGDHLHLYWQLIGFALFRLFDISKLFPINLLDKKVHGGFGIMLDDLLAGVYAGGGLYLVIYAYRVWLGV